MARITYVAPVAHTAAFQNGSFWIGVFSFLINFFCNMAGSVLFVYCQNILKWNHQKIYRYVYKHNKANF